MKTRLMLSGLLLAGCPDNGGGSGMGPGEGSGSSTGPGSDPTSSSSTGPDATDATSTTGAPGDGSSSGGDSTDGWPDPKPPLECPDEYNCNADQDLDAFPLQCDNAPDHTNPDQGDMDFDSIGDVADLCPTIQSPQNTADSDRDGVGNDCDLCPRPASVYAATGVGSLSAAFAHRSLPDQGDADGDGIGDACDNCVQTPNCLGYGEDLEHELGIVLDIEDPQCQADTNGDFIGDACEGTMLDGAAGPVGMGPNDDFDQDGLRNADDACVRLPVANPSGAHLDSDQDGLGDRCDNCPFTPNPDQTDADSDSVGDACEEAACAERANPRPFGFFDAAAGGWCCTTAYRGEPLFDPDGNPLDVTDLPPLGVGVLELPPGCDGEGQPLTLDDVDSDEALWEHLCLLPQWDQDYDALPDTCDLCRWAFDPTNAPFVDDSGMTWPNDGAVCNGEYHCSAD